LICRGAEAAREASETGMPIIRPMELAFQHDAVVRRHIWQLMVGPGLLVAPTCQPGMHRNVYLCAGGWIDFWSGERMKGPREFKAEGQLGRMPICVREGAILPLLPEAVDTLVEANSRLEFQLRANGAALRTVSPDSLETREAPCGSS
jgi:alpha-glucosidase (family GH31 glycosyl hydrolase)